jgi:hypothetical protein
MYWLVTDNIRNAMFKFEHHDAPVAFLYRTGSTVPTILDVISCFSTGVFLLEVVSSNKEILWRQRAELEATRRKIKH